MSYGTLQIEKMTTESGYSLGAGNASSFKNRVINGGMVLDQRNAGAAVTASDTANAIYTVDRWAYRVLAASKISLQRSSVAPAGFSNSLLVTSLSAYSIGANEFLNFRQPIEGFNVADLGWGTADAKSVTLSFQVRSSLTGTFGGYISNSTESRYYVFSYTINSANTWETKTITITGDTSGTYYTDNRLGILLGFSIAAGANYQGTPGSWGTTAFVSPAGQVNLAGTNGATFYITGVQFEVGTVATSFDFRDYGRELILCQRYYQRYGVNSTGPAGDSGFLTGVAYSSIAYFFPTIIPITMRTGPSVSISGLGDLGILTNGSTTNPNGFGISGSGVVSGGSGANRIEFYGTTASAFASGGQAVWLRLGSSGWVALLAEL